jgi:hypothetical protein
VTRALVILATAAVGILALLLLALIALTAAALIAGWRDRDKVLTEQDAATNSAPWRPNVFPIDPAYVGLPPHNGKVADSSSEETASQ